MKKQNPFGLLFISLLLLIFMTALTACGKSTPQPTTTPELILTEIAFQVSAGLTQTAAAKPTFTVEAPLPPTEPIQQEAPTLSIATLESSSQPTVQESPPTEPVQAQPTSQSDCTYRAELYYESIKDGTMFEENKTFTRVWDLKNVGTCTWPVGTYLRFIGGDIMGADAVQVIVNDKPIPPGGRVRAESLLKVPNLTAGVFQLPVQGSWMLATPDGHLFGLGPDGKGYMWTKIIACYKKGCKE